MMKVYKMTHLPKVLYGETACFYCDKTLNGLTGELEVSEAGEIFQLEVVDMEKKEFEELPEFEGW